MKWTAEEEEALLVGVAKNGPGKWKNILQDSKFPLSSLIAPISISRLVHPDLRQLELRYWLNPNQVYQSGLKGSQFKLSNARSICLLDFPIPAEDTLNWVCDYPEGDIRLSTDNWIDRNYDYFEFL
ncbi:hypothetical protein QYF36_024592 [Acer negundo]|nr:hypothetical protein QYF36_024592 [Acer negundo]